MRAEALIAVFVAVAGCLAGSDVAAATGDAAGAVRLAYPGAAVLQAAVGDLDADGVADIAALLREGPSPNASIRLVVLHGTQTGFVRWDRSGDLGEFPKGEPEIAVKGGSLYLYSKAGTCCSVDWEHLQFKYRDGRFRLIGVTVGALSEGQDEPKAMDDESSEIDLNLLTGERHEARAAKGHRSHAAQTRVAVPAPRWLESFKGLAQDQQLARMLALPGGQ